ncbi:MAG TPA: RNA polymerase sigma factor [Solirubrobacteraceae bacterium]|jgi:RNA polymerase sigma-70 factor (ECF subfamily)|nr:RNA polymerase sigma factor [Solirubrobacteraceae bacterium]
MDERVEDDAALVALIAKGDDEAFAVLYRRYLPLVVRWSLRQTGNRELAADLASEVFAAALIAARRYDPNQGAVAAWLLGIAKNKLRESQRRRRVEDSARRKLGLVPIALNDAAFERVEELASIDADLAGLVAALPVEQREAILQRVVAERPYEDIASDLSCSASVVRQRVSRGLKTLRSELEEQ